MNKKQFLWLVLALAIFAATGYAGVQSAATAREQSAALMDQAAQTFTDALGATAPGVGYDLPEEPYMARVDIVGTIAESGGTSFSAAEYSHQATLSYIDALTADPDNLGLLLYIDSPGGEMKASDDLYLKLMDYKEATGRPIFCYFDGMACSGGYYAAMAADEIYANRNCMCVNIGVYISTYNMAGLFEKLGVEQVVFKSSENKGIGMTGVPWTDEQKEIYQSIVDLHYDQFLSVVASGRNMTKAQVAQKNDGREMLSSQALEAGFIDGIARYQDYETGVLEEMGTDILYELSVTENPWQSIFQYISSNSPKSDTQAMMEFAEANSGFVVMAYAG